MYFSKLSKKRRDFELTVYFCEGSVDETMDWFRIVKIADEISPVCRMPFEFNEIEDDHIDPWGEGGKTEIDNLKRLCNRRKGPMLMLGQLILIHKRYSMDCKSRICS